MIAAEPQAAAAGSPGSEGATRAPRDSQLRALRAAERALALDPESLDLQLARAALLQLLGDDEEAKAAYLRILRRDPDHLDSLRNLAQVLLQGGYRGAARTLLQRAVDRHPDDLASHVNLGTLLFQSGELDDSQALFERALRLWPECPQAHAGLSLVLDAQGDAPAAQAHRQRGFSRHSVVSLPYRGDAEPVRVLMLAATNQGNIPIERHLDDRTFETSILTPEYHEAGKAIPDHDLIVNAIGDADAALPALHAASRLLGRLKTPVINAPAAVAATGRCENWRRLGTLAGVVAPRALRLPRTTLAAPDAVARLRRHGMDLPLLLRSPGYHTGEHFLRVTDRAGLAAAVAQLPGDELLAIEFIDTRDDDGKTRKYRAMMVGGTLHPLHLAVSQDWKVHYFTADMANEPAHRAEDERFLQDMNGVLGARAVDTLRRIQAALGLDYAGIDFALSPERKIILFEANATMVVPQPPPDPRWDYRRGPVARIDAAVRRMLLARAGVAARASAVAAQ
jgi:tetratricopeptide (TPR) repeat protein